MKGPVSLATIWRVKPADLKTGSGEGNGKG